MSGLTVRGTWEAVRSGVETGGHSGQRNRFRRGDSLDKRYAALSHTGVADASWEGP